MQFDIRGQLVQDVIENKGKDMKDLKDQLRSSTKYAAEMTTQLAKAQTEYQVSDLTHVTYACYLSLFLRSAVLCFSEGGVDNCIYVVCSYSSIYH